MWLAEHPRELARRNPDKLRAKTNIRIGCDSLANLVPGKQALHELLTQFGFRHPYKVVPDVVQFCTPGRRR